MTTEHTIFTLTGTANAAGLEPAAFTGTLELAGLIPVPVPTDSGAVRGAWTPVIGMGGTTGPAAGQHYQFQTGHFVRIGQLVYLWAYTQFDSKGDLSGPLSLTGFPFPTMNAPGFFAGSCAFFSNLAPSAAFTGLMVYAGGTQREAMLFGVEQGRYMNPRRLLGEEVNDHSQFVISIAYPTESA